ncbi:10989_t:CDS:2 [Entrophospora sp. SA101]|nr:10989_t:CDS:2 [Entrophospora sp. SA101]
MSSQSIFAKNSVTTFTSNNNNSISQKNNSKLFFSSTNLKIKLLEPNLFLRGNSRESLGCFLRGELILILNKPTKIKKLELKFNGSSKTFWPEGRIYYGLQSNSYLKNTIRKLASKDYTILQPNIYTFPFELFIPGDLPETIETDLGSVSYKLSATLFRSGFSSNLHVSQQVPIIRASMPEEINFEGIVTYSEWKDLFGYEILIPKKAYPIGRPIEICLKLIPKVKNLDFVELKVKLKESCIYKSKDRKKQESKVLKTVKIENLDKRIDEINNLIYHKNISFILPKPSKKIHSSCKTTFISIRHYFEKKKIDVKVDIPIILFSCKYYDDLPQYERINYGHDENNEFSYFFESDNRFIKYFSQKLSATAAYYSSIHQSKQQSFGLISSKSAIKEEYVLI